MANGLTIKSTEFRHIKVLIIGASGQDGTLLRSQLTQENVSWIGIDLNAVYGFDMQSLSFPQPIDVCMPEHVNAIIQQTTPDNIYYLAAHHRSSSMIAESTGSFLRAGYAVNAQGPLNFLEAITNYSHKSKFLYVSSSLIFIPTASPDQRITESSPIAPMESYAFEKLIASHYCREFRDKHSIHASIAIPFNHESKYRKPGFFSRDVTDAIAEICFGKREYLEVGSLDAIVDWSYAGDVVSAFKVILDHTEPDDFIISSGTGHTTGDFIKLACDYAGIDFSTIIRVKPDKVTRRNHCRIGDSSKLRILTGWKPKIEFPALVKQLMQFSLDRMASNKNHI